jgi:hypothetical protein
MAAENKPAYIFQTMVRNASCVTYKDEHRVYALVAINKEISVVVGSFFIIKMKRVEQGTRAFFVW